MTISHSTSSVLQRYFSVTVIAILSEFYFWLSRFSESGRDLSLSLIFGALFGLFLQRSRFCFFCVTRDFIDQRDSRGLLGILVALIVGTIGYAVVFGAILPEPTLSKRLPPDAHIGPVSWMLALAALVFGAGMALSGSCISAHLYRLGEGAFTSLFALVGVIAGFLLGFTTWNWVYLRVIQDAPVIWLPNHWGYDGAVLAQLAVLTGLALILIRWHRSSVDTPAVSTFQAIFTQRWPAYVGGILIGALGTAAYFRIAPLGVTAEIGSIARTLGDVQHWLPERLEGLDSFTGCATVVKETLLSNNGVFIIGLILAALAAALAAGQFKPQLPNWRSALRQCCGGILLGWGSMTALGCTVGTLLSGIMAGAVSGWVFAVFCLLGLWLTWRIRRSLST